jgi:hypothetical protein
VRGLETYLVNSQSRVSLLHSIINLFCEVGVDLASSGRRNRSDAFHRDLLYVLLYQAIDLRSAVHQLLFAMGVGLHDERHVDLYGLELFPVMDIAILGELFRNVLKSVCQHAATFVSLGELLLRGCIRMVSVHSVRHAQYGRLGATHSHSIGDLGRRLNMGSLVRGKDYIPRWKGRGARIRCLSTLVIEEGGRRHCMTQFVLLSDYLRIADIFEMFHCSMIAESTLVHCVVSLFSSRLLIWRTPFPQTIRDPLVSYKAERP